MAHGAESKRTKGHGRQAVHLEQGYEERGLDPKEAARREWTTGKMTNDTRLVPLGSQP